MWASYVSAFSTNVNEVFASDGVLSEVACASSNTCSTDQLAFRAVLARGLANALTLTSASNNASSNPLASSLRTRIRGILQTSATGAAAQCSGGSSGTICGSDWSSARWDGTQGLGQSLSALEVILANLPARPLAAVNSTMPTPGNGTIPSGSPAVGSNNGTGGSAYSSDARGVRTSVFAMAGVVCAAALLVL